MTIGEKIHALRKKKGLSQEYVANTIRVSRQAVSKWERDESTPDLDNVKQLIILFDVTIDYLVKEEILYDGSVPSAASFGEILKAEYRAKYKKWYLLCVGLVVLVVLFNQIIRFFDIPLNSFIWRFTFGFGAPMAKLWAIAFLFVASYIVLGFKTRERKRVL